MFCTFSRFFPTPISALAYCFSTARCRCRLGTAYHIHHWHVRGYSTLQPCHPRLHVARRQPMLSPDASVLLLFSSPYLIFKPQVLLILEGDKHWWHGRPTRGMGCNALSFYSNAACASPTAMKAKIVSAAALSGWLLECGMLSSQQCYLHFARTRQQRGLGLGDTVLTSNNLVIPPRRASLRGFANQGSRAPCVKGHSESAVGGPRLEKARPRDSSSRWIRSWSFKLKIET